jgi:hypothetical protein
MKKTRFLFVFILSSCYLLNACHTPPENYFDVAVLNVNMLQGFAGEGLNRELESPSVKATGNKDQYATMTRKEAVEAKIEFVQANYEKLKKLKETSDTKDILQNSLALHEYILPVYKGEYVQLAKLYDEGATKEAIMANTQSIHDKYSSGYEELYNKLIGSGKGYAERNNIKVNWAQ